MIDPSIEQVITLTAASRLPILRRSGRGPALSTIIRWINGGVRGVRLETIRNGGHRATSVEAVDRFVARLNGHQLGQAQQAKEAVTAHVRAEAALQLAGI